MIWNLISYYAFCLFATIIIEEFVALIVLRIKNKSDILLVLLVNVLTNPIVVTIQLFTNQFTPIPWIVSLIILEVSAWLAEGFIYKRGLYYERINPYLISLILNCCSYFIGNIINNWLELF